MAVALAAAALLVPAWACAQGGGTLPWLAALTVGALGAWLLARRLPPELDGATLRAPRWTALFSLFALVAIVQAARLSLFMGDARLVAHSMLPFDVFYRLHSCLTAYFHAAQISGNTPNLYNPALYQVRQGPFAPDVYLYPPPFLLLARALLSGGSFLHARAVWFAFELTVLAAAALALSIHIGGRSGAVAALLVPVVLMALPTALTLQVGNYQVAVFALAVGGMVAFDSGEPVVGGVLLGFAAASKIFPGILILLLLVRRRFTDALFAAAGVLGFVLASWLVLGPAPYRAFFGDALPRIASGAAFFWLWRDLPRHACTIASNQSIYGLVCKLHALGVGGMTPRIAAAVSWVYSGFVAWLTWKARRPTADRAREGALWLALLSLGALRSPFVLGPMASFATLWLLSLWAAPAARQRRTLFAYLAAWLVLLPVWPLGDHARIALAPLALRIGTTTLTLGLIVAIDVWVILKNRPSR